MAAIGLFLFVCATLKTEFVVYRLLVARTKIIWGEYAYRFHQAAGAILIVVGVLWAGGVIW